MTVAATVRTGMTLNEAAFGVDIPGVRQLGLLCFYGLEECFKKVKRMLHWFISVLIPRRFKNGLHSVPLVTAAASLRLVGPVEME